MRAHTSCDWWTTAFGRSSMDNTEKSYDDVFAESVSGLIETASIEREGP